MSSDLQQNVEVQEVLNNLQSNSNMGPKKCLPVKNISIPRKTNSIASASDKERELTESFTAAIAQSAAEPNTHFDQQHQEQEAQAQDHLDRIAEEHHRQMKQQEQIDQSAQAVAAVVAQSEQTAQQVLQHIGTADSSSTLATVPITTSPAPAPAAPAAKPVAGSEEWHKLRRDNHKEVERRRRENINAGINEVSALIPNNEKNKGNILRQAVNYIKEMQETNEKLALEAESANATRIELDSVRILKTAAEAAFQALSIQHEELRRNYDELRRELEERATKKQKTE
ncbi:basic helix-loop-helix protein [Haplosporangium bisporale]|nr:basic helix-loop-helix protein [Haplosporangium bisporale]